MKNSLTPEQINTIKSFPSVIIQHVKNALHSNPERKNDFQWIYESCITECKVRNISIENLLHKNGYNSRPPTFREKQTRCSTTGYLSRKRYVHHTDSFTSQEANSKVQAIMDNTEAFNKMVNLMGEDAALMFQKKMIDNIINHTQEG